MFSGSSFGVVAEIAGLAAAAVDSSETRLR